MLTIRENIEGERYHQLINLLAEHCNRFAFVENILLKEYEKKRINYIDNLTVKIKDHLIKTNIQTRWETTILGEGTAYVFYYELNDATSAFLKEKSRSLFGWINPKLPEDIMFYQDKKCLLAGCSHEGFFIVDETLWNQFLEG